MGLPWVNPVQIRNDENWTQKYLCSHCYQWYVVNIIKEPVIRVKTWSSISIIPKFSFFILFYFCLILIDLPLIDLSFDWAFNYVYF
jgi:hypothetical protein